MDKKKILLIAAILVVVVFLIAMIAGGNDSKDTTQTTQPTQTTETTQATEEPEDFLFKDGNFAFTVSEFAERLGGTLPEGYTLAETITEPTSQGGDWLLPIQNTAGEDTGMVISMHADAVDQAFDQMAIVSSKESDVAAFETVLNWYVGTFMAELTPEARADFENVCLEIFRDQSDGSAVKATHDCSMMMFLFKDAYYLVLNAGKG